MVKTVAVLAQKGGSGKSTLSRHGSVILPRCGLLDLDPQGTSRKWVDRRKAAGMNGPALVTATAEQLPTVLVQANGKLDWLIIDTPPSHDDTRAIRSAVALADFVLIAVKPSPDDLDALADTLALVRGKPAAFVVTMATRSRMLERVQASLAAVAGVALAPVTIANRVAYPEAAEDGAAVTEAEPHGPAADEMRRLWTWVAASV